MFWFTIALLVVLFVVLAFLAGPKADELPPNHRQRVKERLARGGYPPTGWEV